MASKWRVCTVDEIKADQDGAIAIGPFGSRMKADRYVASGVPVVRGTNISSTRAFVGDLVFVSEETADELRSSNVFAGDLVFPHRGAIGQVGIIPTDAEPRYVQSTSLMKLTCNRDLVDPMFAFYFFRSAQGRHALLQHASTVGTPGIGQPLTSLRSISLPVPPLSEQHAIAHILGTLDDKIELNRRMNETLEAMARALFKSWFVDFDPVCAKIEGRDPGLSQPLADLFPDRFEETALGEVPEGWACAGLGEWVTVLSGGTPAKNNAKLWDGDIPWISPKVMTGVHADDAEAYVTEGALGNGTRLAPAHATLVMVRGMGLHEKVRISQTRHPVAFNQDVKALVPSRIEPSLLLFALLGAQPTLLNRVESSGHGTGRLPSDLLLSHPIVMPNPEVQAKLTRPFDVLNDRLASAREEARLLTMVRDTLLPKLISGELRVDDAVRIAEVAK